ncbi:YhgE/Pip domain-containing protein [Kitasatospora sp. NPDC050543]|uniref:YhgE/Pip domain-containing protein n=1 Tax=Kitasatospora sp. NPDC050543 TaxID=3364054 RepID=UPI0037942F81
MSSKHPAPQAQVTAGQVLRNPRIWVFPTVLVGLLALLLSLIYMGGVLDPRGHLHRMPIGLVNADQGAVVAGQQTNLGARVTAGIAAAPDPEEQISWRQLDQAGAMQGLASGKLCAVLEVRPDFTAAVAQLGATTGLPEAPQPRMTVFTNPGAGSLASSLATSIAQQAAHQASLELGRTLLAQLPQQGAQATNAERIQLADPATIDSAVGHPIGSHSGLGLTAFYYTLLLVLSGFLGANIIANGVDVSLGYAASELGPWRTQLPTVPITRTRTLMITCTMSVVLSLLTSSLVMLACVTILGMDASHLPLLWVFSVCASAAVGLGVQALLAAFGGIGQLISMFVFIALSLPSSGATIPLQALPGFYRWLSEFEPMRQLTDGVRAILYFDAQGEAGLTRAWIMIAIGVVAALAFGFAMTTYYDRKGLHRIVPEHHREEKPEPGPGPGPGAGPEPGPSPA